MRLPRLFLITAFLVWTGALSPVQASSLSASKDSAKVRTGRWSGNVELVSGFGFLNWKEITFDSSHLRETGTLNLLYDSPTFQFNTSLGSRYEKNFTTKERLILNSSFFGGIYSDESSDSKSGFINAGARWRPNSRNTYSVGASFSPVWGDQLNSNAVFTLGSIVSADVRVEERETIGKASSINYNSSHFFQNTRFSLHTSFNAGASSNKKTSTWAEAVLKEHDELEETILGDTYKLTPHSTSNNAGASITLRDSTFAGVSSLLAEGGIRLRGNRLLDHYSGAILVEEDVWRDSVRLRENFNYLELYAEPNVRMSYHKKGYGADLHTTIQFYGNHLTDKDKRAKVNWRPPSTIGNFQFFWNLAPAHRLAVGGSRSVTHPEYQKICWYDRQGAVEGQLFRGDPDLNATVRSSAFFDYQLNIKRFRFTSRSALTHTSDEIEQFFQTEIIDGRPYTVFQWDNTAYGDSFNHISGLYWNGKVLTSSLLADYLQERRHKYESGDKIKDSHRWIIRAGVGVHPGHGWDFSADGIYQGDIVTFYSILKEYVTVSARISKRLGKITISLDGRDLLDRKRVVTFYSEDLIDSWEEESRMNRRLILLGFRWNF